MIHEGIFKSVKRVGEDVGDVVSDRAKSIVKPFYRNTRDAFTSTFTPSDTTLYSDDANDIKHSLGNIVKRTGKIISRKGEDIIDNVKDIANDTKDYLGDHPWLAAGAGAISAGLGALALRNKLRNKKKNNNE